MPVDAYGRKTSPYAYTLPQEYGYTTTDGQGWPPQPYRQQSMSPQGRGRSQVPLDLEKPRREHRHHRHRPSPHSDRSFDYADEKKRHRSRSRRDSHRDSRRDSHLEYGRTPSPLSARGSYIERERTPSRSIRTAEEDAISEKIYRHRRNKTVLGVMGSIVLSIMLCHSH